MFGSSYLGTEWEEIQYRHIIFDHIHILFCNRITSFLQAKGCLIRYNLTHTSQWHQSINHILFLPEYCFRKKEIHFSVYPKQHAVTLKSFHTVKILQSTANMHQLVHTLTSFCDHYLSFSFQWDLLCTAEMGKAFLPQDQRQLPVAVSLLLQLLLKPPKNSFKTKRVQQNKSQIFGKCSEK